MSHDSSSDAGNEPLSIEMASYPPGRRSSRVPEPGGISTSSSLPDPYNDARPTLSSYTSAGATRSISDVSHAHLLNPGPHVQSAGSHPSTLRTLLKTLRLQVLHDPISWLFSKCKLGEASLHRSTGEKKKVAISKSRKYATLQCVIHILPVLAVIAIVVLNLVQFYIGGELSGTHGQDDEKLAALQFAGKLHELLMLASLGVIMFTAIRKELANGDGVPFGALFTGLAIDSLSTLWSMEFWSVVFHARAKTRGAKWRKWWLVLLLLVGIILGTSVGPSTNNLMRPVLDDWPAGGTSFWIDATADDLYPLELHETPGMDYCLSSLDHSDCPYGDYDVIARDYMSYYPTLKQVDNLPESIYVSGRHALRQMSLRARSIDNGSRILYPNAFTMATLGPAAVADSLGYLGGLWAFAAANAPNRRNFRFRNDATFGLNTQQPIVMTFCQPQSLSTSVEDNYMSFAKFDSLPPDFDALSNSTTYENVSISNTTSLLLSQQYVASRTSPGIFWLDDARLRSATGSTLNAIVVPPQTTLDPPQYYCCSIDSRQAGTRLSVTRNRIKLVNGVPDGWDLTGTFNHTWPRVYPSTSWTKYLNPEIRQLNSTEYNIESPFIALTEAAGMGQVSPRALPWQAQFIVESAVASLLANGIARWSYNMSLAGTLRGRTEQLWEGGEWSEEFLPRKSLGYGGNAFIVSKDEQQRSTELIMQATVNGYAYGGHGATQLAAICTLLVYAILASGHTLLAIINGYYSGCWDTAPEITMLAMNSAPTPAVKGTGAGIDTIGPHREVINIVVKSDHLEIVPTSERHPGDEIKAGYEYA